MQACEFSSQPAGPRPDEWTSRPVRATGSGFSLFHRHRDSRNGSNAASAGVIDKHPSRDGDGDDSSSIASTSTAAGASFVTQNTDTTAQTAPPPPYNTLDVPSAGIDSSASPDRFRPTLQLHIDSAGRGACMTSALFSSGSDTTPVYVVDGSSDAEAATIQAATCSTSPAFVSLRKSRGSSTCSLVAGAGYASVAASATTGAAGDALRTLSTTTYRFGPGRPPRIDVGGNLSAAVPTDLPIDLPTDARAPWDSFAVQSKSIWSRSQRIQTRLGTFEWRYASSAERKDLSKELLWQAQAEAGAGAHSEDGGAADKKARKKKEKEDKAARKHHSVKSLLVLEQIVPDAVGPAGAGAGAGARPAPRETRRLMARFIRNAELRTPGSSRHAAGNGGRLQIDLRAWQAAARPVLGKVLDKDEKRHTVDSAVGGSDREMMIITAVTTAICMLKKEVDRRQGEEAAAIASAAS